MPPRDSVVINGASRGIGFGITKFFACAENPTRHVFACCRNPDKADRLQALKAEASPKTKFHIIKMDATKPDQIKAAAAEIGSILDASGSYLNLLINNAGGPGDIKHWAMLSTDEKDFMETLHLNTVSPNIVIQAFLPLLKKAAEKADYGKDMTCTRAAVINISSSAGSIDRRIMYPGATEPMVLPADKAGGLAYCTSKAGLNMSTKLWSMADEAKGILFVSQCPGGVFSDRAQEVMKMTAEEMPKDLNFKMPVGFQTVDECVNNLVTFWKTMTAEHNGGFYGHKGTKYPY